MLIPQMSMGGAEKVFYDHAKAFAKHHNIIECVFTKKNFEPSFITGNTITELDNCVAGTSIERFNARRARLRKIFADYNIDMCISHMEGANILSGLTKAESVKKFMCVHGSLQHDTTKYGIRKLLFNHMFVPLSYNRAAKVVAVSKGIAGELVDLHVNPDKIISIPNFFDIPAIRNKAEEPLGEFHQLFSDYKVLISIGRLGIEKNHKALIKIFNSIVQKDKAFKLMIVGDGSLRMELLHYCKAYNLIAYSAWDANNKPDGNYDVYFTGLQSNPYKFLKKASLFLLTSFNEGFPMVLGEAMCCGTPVISVDCHTGPREMLSFSNDIAPKYRSGPEFSDCGILMPALTTHRDIEENHVQQWVSAIKEITNNNTLKIQMVQQASVKVQEYAKESVMQQWMNLINL